MFAQIRAATVAPVSTEALPVSVRRKVRSGVSIRRAQAVRPENAPPAKASSDGASSDGASSDGASEAADSLTPAPPAADGGHTHPAAARTAPASSFHGDQHRHPSLPTRPANSKIPARTAM